MSSGSDPDRRRSPRWSPSEDQSGDQTGKKKKKKKRKRSRSREGGRKADRGPFGAGVKVALGDDGSSSNSSFREASSSRDRQLQLLEYSEKYPGRLSALFVQKMRMLLAQDGAAMNSGGPSSSGGLQLPPDDPGSGVQAEARDQAAPRAEDPLQSLGSGGRRGGAASRRHPRPWSCFQGRAASFWRQSWRPVSSPWSQR